MTVDSRGRGPLRHPRNAMQVYRALYYIMHMLSYTFAFIVWMFEVTCFAVCSWLLYFSVGSRGPLMERLTSFSQIALFGVYCTFFVKEWGWIGVLSTRVLKTWGRDYIGCGRRGRDWEIDRRVLRSLGPIRVNAGSVYFFDQMSILVLWEQIVDKCIFLLSAFPLT